MASNTTTSNFRIIATFATLAFVVGTGVVACTSEAAGNPTPQSITETTSPSTTPRGDEDPSRDVPQVRDPLDASRFISQPCNALTQAQLNSFNVTDPGEPTTTGGVAKHSGPFCTWFSDHGSGITVAFLIGLKNGLADTYSGRDLIDSFIPTRVDSYPAVFANDPDLRARGTCNIIVAISNTSTFQAIEQGSLGAEDSCARAKQVAAAVLETIRGGS